MRRAAFASVLAASSLALAHAQQTNAPVSPDTIYVARIGAATGISIIDLNGFGASTGNPTFDPVHPATEGNTNFPNNPNVKLQGALMVPHLAPGTTTLDGGSAGVFTLTKDSTLNDLLLRSPSMLSVGDMMLGHPLDASYNDGPAPFGCQAGGGNLCATTAKKLVQVSLGNLHTLLPASGGPTLNIVAAGENPISWAPHPNPPPLITPPLCAAPYLGGEEATSIDTSAIVGLSNLLGPGDPFGVPSSDIPPTGLLTLAQNAFFQGPGANQPTIISCPNYMIRQQIGHYLYAIDSVQNEVVVLNSNTMRVLKRITVADPTELAMSPRLNLLAVTQRSAGTVAFIDIDPSSATFHLIVRTATVGAGPTGIAWTPDNEDILVCNQDDSSVSILSALNLSVRKVVHRGLDRPFAIAITPRQTNFGFQHGTYFAYILDKSGRVSLFESGPNGVNGWGYDDIIGQTSYTFPRAKAIQPDHIRLASGVWIVHENQLDAHGVPTSLTGGAVSNLVLDSTMFGVIPLTALDLAAGPNMRSLSFRIDRSIGSDQLTGIPTDLAFDNLRNYGALRDEGNPFSHGVASDLNSKNLVRQIQAGSVNTNEPTYMFLPVRTGTSGAEAIDVVRLSDGHRIDTNAFHAGLQSIPAGGAAIVMDYFRQ